MKINSITVIGRKWFDSRAGNTYFTAAILINGLEVHRLPYEYGYADQYLQSAFEWLDAAGHTSRERYVHGGHETPRDYCTCQGIALHYEAADVKRKRDL